jgi:arsenate reductase-like glutaredoxin family protein
MGVPLCQILVSCRRLPYFEALRYRSLGTYLTRVHNNMYMRTLWESPSKLLKRPLDAPNGHLDIGYSFEHVPLSFNRWCLQDH